MKLLICGSRSIVPDRYLIPSLITQMGIPLLGTKHDASAQSELEIIVGGAKGIDTAGEKFAKNWRIPVTVFHAEWERYGKHKAGFIRNSQMVAVADACLAIWDGESHGTADTIAKAKQKGILTLVYNMSGYHNTELTPAHKYVELPGFVRRE